MSLFVAVSTTGNQFPVYFVAVYVIGFIAAVVIGSFAWYNSKRPAGWENSQRPDFVPEINAEKKSDSKE